MRWRRRGAAPITAMRVAIVMVLLAPARVWPSGSQDRPVAHTVVMSGTAFIPTSLSVTVGDTVTWVNDDFFPHTATSTGGAFDSGSIDAGGRWTLTTVKAGEYPYVCAVHPTMKGTLRVNAPR